MTNPKITKSSRGRGKRPKWVWVLWVAIVAGIVAAIVSVRISPTDEGSSSSEELKAAIIDQLYAFGLPNQEFIQEVAITLESYGFKVDLYQGDEVTVDFYRELPTHGYKLIIFRTHSGLIKAEGQAVVKTSLFTSEGYSRNKYVKEQLNDELVQARVDEGYPFYFAITPEFITNRMKGQFDDTVVIISGCSCLYLHDLAQAFTNKEVSAYLAWDRTVGLDYVDDATMTLIRNLSSEGLTIEGAVVKTMEEKGPDPEWGAVLKYYPSQSGNKRIKELINWHIEEG